MNFARTCHQALSTVMTKARLSGHRRSPAEDVFFTTAHQRLEESARMLSAMRLAALTDATRANGLSERRTLLSLDGHGISRYTGKRVEPPTPYVPPQGQETQDVTHAA